MAASTWGIRTMISSTGMMTGREAEDTVIKRADRLFADMGANIEVRNQARVRFGLKPGLAPPILSSLRPPTGLSGFSSNAPVLG